MSVLCSNIRSYKLKKCFSQKSTTRKKQTSWSFVRQLASGNFYSRWDFLPKCSPSEQGLPKEAHVVWVERAKRNSSLHVSKLKHDSSKTSERFSLQANELHIGRNQPKTVEISGTTVLHHTLNSFAPWSISGECVRPHPRPSGTFHL